MKIDYNLLLKQYSELLQLLQIDEREVSKEMIQIIYDDIEDIQITLGKASQIQPSIEGELGFKIPN
jgi:hypothetical protein